MEVKGPSWVTRGQTADEMVEAALRMVPVSQLMESSTPLAANLTLRRPVVRRGFLAVGLLLIFGQTHCYYSGIHAPPPASRFRFRVLAGSSLQLFANELFIHACDIHVLCDL